MRDGEEGASAGGGDPIDGARGEGPGGQPVLHLSCAATPPGRGPHRVRTGVARNGRREPDCAERCRQVDSGDLMSTQTAMRHLMWLLTAACVAPFALAAQTSDSGAFVITLGTDTLALERYLRPGDRLVDHMVLRTRAAVTGRHLVATVSPDGSIARLELDSRPTGASHAGTLHGVATFKPDQVVFATTRHGHR